MNVLAIIPARSGSKGLPHKNKKQLLGKPLISYTIEAACNSKYINKTIVTTDDQEIATIALKYGAEVPFMRPKELAHDTTPMIDVVLHSVDQVTKDGTYHPDQFVLLQPTCPLRTALQIDEAFRLFYEHNPSAVLSVCEVEEHPYLMKTIKNNTLTDLIPSKYTRRQDFPLVYILNGAIYICNTSTFLSEKQLQLKGAYPYIMSKEDSIDIDTEVDFKRSEALLKKKLNRM